MPKKKKRKQYEKAGKELEAFGCIFAENFIAPAYLIPRALFTRDGIGVHKNKWHFGLDVFGLAILWYLLFAVFCK
jgi:hypothetical protein